MTWRLLHSNEKNKYRTRVTLWDRWLFIKLKRRSRRAFRLSAFVFLLLLKSEMMQNRQRDRDEPIQFVLCTQNISTHHTVPLFQNKLRIRVKACGKVWADSLRSDVFFFFFNIPRPPQREHCGLLPMHRLPPEANSFLSLLVWGEKTPPKG